MASEESRFCCIICTFVGNDSSKLRTHLEKEHPRQTYFWCRWCGKLSEYVDDYFEHLEKDLCSEMYQHPCGFDDCDFTDQEPSRFITHIKNMHRGKPLIPCKYCKRLFTMPPCLIQHLQSECCHRPNAQEVSISKDKDKPLQQDLEEDFLHNQSTSQNKVNKEHHSKKSTNPKEKLPAKTKSNKRKKDVEKIPNKKKHVELFDTYSDSDVDDPTWNPREDEDDLKEKPKRVGRQRKNASSQKARVEENRAKGENSESKQTGKINEKHSSGDEEAVFETYKTWRDWLEKMREFKSQQALDDLLQPEKLTNFFKCMHNTCSFSSQSKMEFVVHLLSSDHEKSHRCCYCFLTFDYIEKFSDHLLQNHSDRRFQCTACLYRSSTKANAKLHVRTAHDTDESVSVVSCPKLDSNSIDPTLKPVPAAVVKRNRYNCTEIGCQFSSLETEVFVKHFEEEHPKIVYYQCSYCTYKTSNMSLLLKHFQKHKIFDFECFYCPFGAEESENVLLHMSINHADMKIQVLSRKTNSKKRNEENENEESTADMNVKKEEQLSKSQVTKNDEEIAMSVASTSSNEKSNNFSTSSSSERSNDVDSENSLPENNQFSDANNSEKRNDERGSQSLKEDEPAMEVDVNSKGFSVYGLRPAMLNMQRIYYFSNNVKYSASDFGKQIKNYPKLVLTDARRICI